MTTDPEQPVILVTLTGPGGEPAGPLLTGGCHRLCKAAVTGRAEVLAYVLTAAETLLIRSDAVPGAAPSGAARGHRATPAPPRWRRTPMLTGIATRTSAPHEDAEPWPGGSARPVLAYLTGTLGMAETDARELALDSALGLVQLALYQLGSAEGASGQLTSTEGEPA